ncbi:hypothetical protein ACLMJK_002410 [Lecanora helva]
MPRFPNEVWVNILNYTRDWKSQEELQHLWNNVRPLNTITKLTVERIFREEHLPKTWVHMNSDLERNPLKLDLDQTFYERARYGVCNCELGFDQSDTSDSARATFTVQASHLDRYAFVGPSWPFPSNDPSVEKHFRVTWNVRKNEYFLALCMRMIVGTLKDHGVSDCQKQIMMFGPKLLEKLMAYKEDREFPCRPWVRVENYFQLYMRSFLPTLKIRGAAASQEKIMMSGPKLLEELEEFGKANFHPDWSWTKGLFVVQIRGGLSDFSPSELQIDITRGEISSDWKKTFSRFFSEPQIKPKDSGYVSRDGQ